MNDVILKLASGEEIFTSIAKIDGDMVTFTNPMKIAKRYTETNEGMTIQLNYEPFLDYSGITNHIIHRSHIMVCEPLVPRLVTLYAEMKESTKTAVTNSPVVPGNITIH